MTKSRIQPVSLSEIKSTFVAFREECIWLQTCFNTFNVLFSDDDEVKALLNNSAPTFFGDLNLMFIEYWIIVACRLTDPASTMGHENLTAKYLLEALKQHSLLTPEIEISAGNIESYRALIKDARNRLACHAGRMAHLANTALGEHSELELLNFVKKLQIFNDLVGEAIGEGPLDYRVTSGPGDAYDLLRALQNSDRPLC